MTSPPDNRPTRRSDWLVLMPLWLMVLAVSSQVMIVAPVLPRIELELGISEDRLGFVVTGYALSLALFALVAGPISDRIGRRRIILIGTGIMSVALGMHQFASDFWSLVGVRVLAGAAGGALTGSAVSYVGDYFPYHRRGWASGWVMSGFAVGQVAGVPTAALLADAYGFRSAFVLFAAVCAVAFAMAVPFVPQPDVERSESLDVRTSAARYHGLLRQRPVAFSGLAYASMFFAISSFVVYFPKWAETSRGLSPGDIASLFMIGGIASVLFGIQTGKLSDRIGRKPMIIASCWGNALLFVITPWFVVGTFTAHIMFFVAMILLAMRMAPFQALLTALSDAKERGSLMSLVVALGQLGSGLGAAVAGSTYGHYGFAGCAIVAGSGIALTGVFVWVGLPEPGRDNAAS